MTIKKLPILERPYEKAQMYGIKNLSNAELLAIIIKTGTKEKTAVELAKEILSIDVEGKENIQFLQDIPIEDLMKIKGIGKVKAIQIKAICELNKRMATPINKDIIKINGAYDVFKLLSNEMKYEKVEKLKVLVLDNKNTLLRIIDVAQGSTNYAVVEIKDILVEAIKMYATRIILVHNHPSGIAQPSKIDVNMTKKLHIITQQLGMELVDHVIIAKDSYVSICRRERIGEKDEYFFISKGKGYRDGPRDVKHFVNNKGKRNSIKRARSCSNKKTK